MQKRYLIWIIVIIIVFIGLTLISLSFRSEIEVNDFESCVKAGNPVMESYPRRCNHNGETYVEDISNVRNGNGGEGNGGDTLLELQDYFSEEIYSQGVENLGAMPIHGFNPELYKRAFPGFVDSDFDGTDAIGGKWELENGKLSFVRENGNGIIVRRTSGDGTITNNGLKRVLDNLSKRLEISVDSKDNVDRIIDILESEKSRNFCNDDQRNVGACITLYDPVCGWNNPDKIQCITYPCASTYSNSCEACNEEGVLYWTKGECPTIPR